MTRTYSRHSPLRTTITYAPIAGWTFYADSTLPMIDSMMPSGVGELIMPINLLWRAMPVAVLSFALASCATSQAEFRKNPARVSKANLCRTFIDTRDQAYILELTAELARRKIDPLECHAMVQQQNQAAAALVAVAIVGTAVAVCANNNCGGPTYPSYRSYPGNCQYEWQYDSAGHRCGKRAASARPGGW